MDDYEYALENEFGIEIDIPDLPGLSEECLERILEHFDLNNKPMLISRMEDARSIYYLQKSMKNVAQGDVREQLKSIRSAAERLKVLLNSLYPHGREAVATQTGQLYWRPVLIEHLTRTMDAIDAVCGEPIDRSKRRKTPEFYLYRQLGGVYEDVTGENGHEHIRHT